MQKESVIFLKYQNSQKDKFPTNVSRPTKIFQGLAKLIFIRQISASHKKYFAIVDRNTFRAMEDFSNTFSQELPVFWLLSLHISTFLVYKHCAWLTVDFISKIGELSL